MGAVYAIFAGFYYWIGKITGYQYNEVLGRIHFILFTIAINLVFFPMHMLGMAGISLFNSEFMIEVYSITLQSLSLIVLKPPMVLILNKNF
jgi:heme/copper-type cytochrome/quinol oxidase subunit 1